MTSSGRSWAIRATSSTNVRAIGHVGRQTPAEFGRSRRALARLRPIASDSGRIRAKLRPNQPNVVGIGRPTLRDRPDPAPERNVQTSVWQSRSFHHASCPVERDLASMLFSPTAVLREHVISERVALCAKIGALAGDARARARPSLCASQAPLLASVPAANDPTSCSSASSTSTRESCGPAPHLEAPARRVLPQTLQADVLVNLDRSLDVSNADLVQQSHPEGHGELLHIPSTLLVRHGVHALRPKHPLNRGDALASPIPGVEHDPVHVETLL